ncbi:MAG: prolyl oligopeptidase family serine peptidase [Fibrobacteres bacterium]|nr:prolyl oligopeptidase family serine peptidase [Fibrobacterota bacterium]
MNRLGYLAASIVAALSATGFAQTTTTLSLQVSGATHSTVIHVPAGIDKPPVVFFIHGATGSGSGFANDTKGNTTADREKFIAVYPSADSKGGSGTWADMQGTTNFPFFFAILDTLDARYKIDRNRIYMTGFSQGGFISYAAACFYSDKFAAVAPVSGHSGTSCSIKRPVPVFSTFGSAEGAASFKPDLDTWLKLDKCPTTATTIKPYPASSANSKAVRETFAPCDQNTTVILDTIIGEGHQWPAASSLNQSDEVWAFFKQYSLGGTAFAHPQRVAQSREPFTVSYAAGIVSVGGVGGNSRVQVTDTKGKLVATPVLTQNQFSFKNKPSGVYLVKARGSAGLFVSKFIVP